MKMWKIAWCGLLVSLLASCERAVRNESSPLYISWADLEREPERYDGKTIQIKCKAVFGDEVSLICSPDGDKLKVWFEVPDLPREMFIAKGFETLALAARQEGRPFWTGEHYITVMGSFSYKQQNQFGHLGAFRAELIGKEVIEVHRKGQQPTK